MQTFTEEWIGALRRVALCAGLAALACSTPALGNDNAAERDRVMAAAKAGNAEAQNELGDRYLRGAGVDRDAAKAADWYRKAADQGYAPAQYLQGLGPQQDDAQAVLWLRRAAELGSPAGQYSLANLYQKGRAGLTKDEAQAMQWYARAAVQELGRAGVKEARLELCLNRKENEVWCAEMDTPGAFGPLEAFTAAADGGDVEAQTRLALMYAKGISVQKDEARSADLYRKAAMAGYAPAQAELGYLYSIGRGVPKDQEEDIYWTCEAAAQGNRRAIRNLAIKQTYDLFDPKECPERRARKR
ncbi:MAG: sel1 repeat family protein [Stenotrophomonas maltophilia]|nr:MAG: sel1 repeat family protein [Stenotrophomonas maltophilia]